MKEFTFTKKANPRRVLALLKESSLAAKFDYVNTKDDEIRVFFKTDLTAAEETGLTKAINELQNAEKELKASLPEFADNAAAITGGLEAGAFYRSGDFVKVVHNGT
jgi:hypothetical protein